MEKKVSASITKTQSHKNTKFYIENPSV